MSSPHRELTIRTVGTAKLADEICRLFYNIHCKKQVDYSIYCLSPNAAGQHPIIMYGYFSDEEQLTIEHQISFFISGWKAACKQLEEFNARMGEK